MLLLRTLRIAPGKVETFQILQLDGVGRAHAVQFTTFPPNGNARESSKDQQSQQGSKFFVLLFQLFICQGFLIFVVGTESVWIFGWSWFAHASLPPLCLNVSIPS